MKLRALLPLLTCLLALLAPNLAQAKKVSPAQKRDAQAAVAPMLKLHRTMSAQSAAITERMTDWQETTTQCLADVDAEQISEEYGGRVGFAVVGLAYADSLQELYTGFEPQLLQVQAQFAAAKLKDPTLRAMLKAKARQMSFFTNLPAFDSCDVINEWREGFFSEEALPQELQPLLADADTQDKADLKAIAKGVKLLKKAGVKKAVVKEFEIFPDLGKL